MSTVGMRKRYTSVMEKIIKNAVSESTKVLETVIAELKAEVLRVKNENENLMIRCSQFEEVVKKRSVYRETGTSPEPWIIEKCDKAVQFDCILHLHLSDDDEPNLSENETQSESSFGPIYEKETSNDLFVFSKTKDMEDNSCNTLDLSNEIMPEKPVADCGKNISESTVVSPHSASDIHHETSEMEIQEEVCIKNAETDQSILECQEANQKEINEKEDLPLQEDICISTETEDVICEKSIANSQECESSPLLALPIESACSSDDSKRAIEETADMDIEFDEQSTLFSSELNTGDSSIANTTDTTFGSNFDQVDASADVSSPPDDPVAISEDIQLTKGPAESEQTCTEIEDAAFHSVSTENIHAKEAQNTSQLVSPPKSQYFLRRQRCTSVTLEDAMLLLDAVSQQKYKSSPPKKSHSKDSSKNVATPKLVKIPNITAPLGHDSSNLEEITCTTESLQGHAKNSGVTIETVEALELNVSLANMANKSDCPSKLSGPVEADRVGPIATPLKHKKSTQVTESSSTLITANTTPKLTPTKQDETMQAVGINATSNDIEEQDKTATSEPPIDADEPLVSPAKRNKKTSKGKLLETEEIVFSDKFAIDSQQHDPNFLSNTPSTKSSSVQPEEDDHTECLSTPTDKGETAQVPPDHTIQKDNEVVQVDVTIPSDSPSSEVLPHTVSSPILQTPIETIGNFDLISGHPTHGGSEFQESDHTVTASSTPITCPFLNPQTPHTVVFKLPGDTGDQSSSVVKTFASSSTLSPAQLSAVVSAVRSTPSVTSPTSSPVGTAAGKKGLVAVPFSLQSVLRPHHKIIVIPRQCKGPTSSAAAKEKTVVLKQKVFTTTTTTFISTSNVNLEKTSDESNVINTVDQQQTTSVTTPTHSGLDTNASSSDPVKSPCKNTVQIKLSRIPFPLSSVESVSVADMPVTAAPKSVVRKKRGRPPLKKKIVEIESTQPKAQPKKNSLPTHATRLSSKTLCEEATLIRSSQEENTISTEENPSPTPEQLVPKPSPPPKQPLSNSSPTPTKQPVPNTSPTPKQPVPNTSPTPKQPVPNTSSTPNQSVPDTSPSPKQPVPNTSPTPKQPVPNTSSTPNQSVPDTSPSPKQTVPNTSPSPKQTVPNTSPNPKQPVPDTSQTPKQLDPNRSLTPEQPVPNPSLTPEQLFPAVAADHSYPQHCMTKSQFLAKLDVSPVTQSLKKSDSIDKDAQKASLVDRLRSHIKPHIKKVKKPQNTETGQDGSKLTVETRDPSSTETTQEIPEPNQDQESESLPLPAPVPHNDGKKTVTPKTSPAPKNVSNKSQVKRKRSPKRTITQTKTVKRRKMKRTTASNEDKPTSRKLSPMRNKIINSNALLSCVRKGIKKKSFLCKFCRKEFSKKKDIEIHIQVHVGKKPFQCNICHRRFSRTMELSRHLKRHNAEKKYQCTSCGKSFIEYNNLKRHTYIHTGEKPYSCPHCSRAFTQSGHMRTHIKNKHKDIED